MLVVSLTSIPPRFATLRPVLASILNQRPRPDRVILALPRQYRRFPGTFPRPALPDGVVLLRLDTDPGPAAKVLPAARALAGTGARLVYCDDDCLYGPGWLAALCAAQDGPDTVVAASGFAVTALRRRSTPAGDTDIAQGFSGVLIRPDMIPSDAYDIPPAAWAVDDIWLSGHYARQDLPIRLAPAARAACTPLNRPGALQDAKIDGQTRAGANAACADLLHSRYGLWPPR
ncbi:glycosyltransferase family A protein [Rhodovulum adriaticum]|uniref:Glycosyl transferase family 2 n=1 Tax=Rhodovulum adriaticum TaxID=35804 RepID=A0A4V2SM93_RHOAD|nr:glycosyltransferase family A protein [Rhodovulum adriaticum]MBK1635260.1 hypothetical protein [Rhodovulum adriaticum]TCP26396.1 hypothetical protein EV656_102362 [Rhodovulum adriaticum]